MPTISFCGTLGENTNTGVPTFRPALVSAAPAWIWFMPEKDGTTTIFRAATHHTQVDEGAEPCLGAIRAAATCATTSSCL